MDFLLLIFWLAVGSWQLAVGGWRLAVKMYFAN
jgi:hypothetical protein